LELVHQTDQIQGLRIIREGDIFKTSKFTQEIEKRTAFSTGIIRNSLYQSAAGAGMSDRLIIEFAEIFGWDIDFAHDIHPGDSFSVIFEEDYVAGEKLGDGDILAAEFTHRNKTYRAIRYTNPVGDTHYYTPEGRAMRQAFLRSPVDFRRISSHFRPQRWHPVLGIKRPHKGVDYAAPTGTPIKASGDGIVTFIGKKGGYGNTIILQHDQRYTTLYAHMSGFTKGLRKGGRVEQGDIIGYVGMTGLATGPHLHYEFRVDGVHMNPVTVELPGAPPLDKSYLADFRKKTTHLTAQLDIYSRTRLAMNTRH
jgi:murein DD-endopeptidase MepM/ murein hydrolase activator NlpD